MGLSLRRSFVTSPFNVKVRFEMYIDVGGTLGTCPWEKQCAARKAHQILSQINTELPYCMIIDAHDM